MDEMIMRFMGTGAGEGVPTPFCRCRVCEHARKVGGKEIRMRSAFRVSKEMQIDFGTDIFAECIRTGLDMYDLKYLLTDEDVKKVIDEKLQKEICIDIEKNRDEVIFWN